MRRIFLFLSPVLLLFSGCASHHPEDMRAIDSLRIEIEAFLHAQAILSYNNWVAGTPSRRDSLYRAHGNIFARPVLDLVARATREETDTTQRQRLTFLRRFLTLEYLSRVTAPLADRCTGYEGEARIVFDGATLLYRQLPALIANEKSSARRERLYAAADPVLDSLNVPALEIQREYRRAAEKLGYASYPAMVEQLKGFSLESVRNLAIQALAESDSLYFALLPSLVRESTGLETADLHRYDFPVLFRSARFDRFFPQKETVASVRETYGSLGIDLAAQGNLSLDTTDHPAKNPRAACYAVSVPGDVRVSTKPVGGVDDFAALYHEMGHAENYAHITEQALEFKYLGEPTVSETFAFLSEYLLCNPAWLRQFSRMPVLQLKDYTRQMAFARLSMVRGYCARFLFEVAFQSGQERPDSLYAALLASTLGYRVHPSDLKRYLVDLDAHYYSASYLRAWFLEAQLNRWLTEAFGVNWYENPHAGTFLVSLWAQGDRLTTEDLLSRIGARGITIDAWLAEIRDMIRLAARPDRP